jgi:hypothetical protein
MLSIFTNYIIRTSQAATFAVAMLCLLCGTSARAQTVPVTGTVLGAEDQQALIGVSVFERGTTNGAMTDLNGKFKIEVGSANAILIFRYTGFIELEMELNGRTTLDVVLTTAANQLQDVVVTGYRKEIRSNIASAIATVKSKDIEKLVIVGIDQALHHLDHLGDVTSGPGLTMRCG